MRLHGRFFNQPAFPEYGPRARVSLSNTRALEVCLRAECVVMRSRTASRWAGLGKAGEGGSALLGGDIAFSLLPVRSRCRSGSAEQCCLCLCCLYERGFEQNTATAARSWLRLRASNGCSVVVVRLVKGSASGSCS